MNPWVAALWYTAGAYFVDVVLRRELAAMEARRYSDSVGKPMINVGAGTKASALFGPTLHGDANVDISGDKTLCRPGVVCHGTAYELPYDDKHFGALLASHVLEHLDEPDRALREWNRVADQVWVIVPSWWAPHTWLHPGHRWVFLKDQRYRLWGQSPG